MLNLLLFSLFVSLYLPSLVLLPFGFFSPLHCFPSFLPRFPFLNTPFPCLFMLPLLCLLHLSFFWIATLLFTFLFALSLYINMPLLSVFISSLIIPTPIFSPVLPFLPSLQYHHLCPCPLHSHAHKRIEITQS